MDIVFGKKWFQTHQRKLIWLLNTPIIKIWFRYVLRIYEKGIINEITPSSYTFGAKLIGDQIELTTDFRTHDKYSKRLYYAFKPFWYLLHFMDWAMLDKVESLTKLSFGFSTLTFYPDPGNPGTVSCDGTVQRTGATDDWATMIAGAGDSFDQASASGLVERILAWLVADQWRVLYRAIFLFDTSALTSGATITAGVLSLFGTGTKTDALGITPNIDIYTSTPASNIQLAGTDYSNLGSVSQTGSPITYAGWSDSAYNDFTFSATGRGNISKTGISKFGTRNANYDVAAVAPTWTSLAGSTKTCFFADQAGTTNDPQLVVTYSLPTTKRNISNLPLLGVS